MAMQSEFNDSFILTQTVVDGKINLRIEPSIKSEGYQPVVLEVTQDQWNDLRYGFITAINDEQGITKLVYL